MSIVLALQNPAEVTHAPTAEQFQLWINAALEDAPKAVNRTLDSLTLRIVTPEESAHLNLTYRGKQGPTNVLSFDYGDTPGEEEHHLGDLVICAELVEKEAKDQATPIETHWAHLVIHGTLHLLGYDHETESQATAMERLESQTMIKLNYKDPYR